MPPPLHRQPLYPADLTAGRQARRWADRPPEGALCVRAGHKQRLEEAGLLWQPPLDIAEAGLGSQASQPVLAEGPVGRATRPDAPFSAFREELEVLQVVVLAVLVPPM